MQPYRSPSSDSGATRAHTEQLRAQAAPAELKMATYFLSPTPGFSEDPGQESDTGRCSGCRGVAPDAVILCQPCHTVRVVGLGKEDAATRTRSAVHSCMEMVLGARGDSQEAPAWPIWSLLCELTLATPTSRVVGAWICGHLLQGCRMHQVLTGSPAPRACGRLAWAQPQPPQGCWYLASARQLGPAGRKVCGRWRSLSARISLVRPPGPQLLYACVGPGGGGAADGARGWFAQGRSGTF